MIQAIKDAIIAAFTPQMDPGGLLEGLAAITDSEVDAQPSGNSPILQIKFASEDPASAIAGFGSPTCFGQVETLIVFLRTTAPEPQASRDLFRLWWQGPKFARVGVKIALQQLVATGLKISDDSWGVQMGAMTAANVRGTNYTAALQCPIKFASMFDG